MGGSKRHNGNGQNGNGHSSNGHGHNSNGHNGARLSPPMQSPQVSAHNNNNNTNQHDDLINYIYESWNKVIILPFSAFSLPFLSVFQWINVSENFEVTKNMYYF